MKTLTNKIYLIASLLCFVVSSVNADIVITELMPCNTSTYINELYNYVGYVELYNNGNEDVDLKGYSFVNNKKNGSTKWIWTIDSSTIVKAREYQMFFFDEIVDKPYHVGYKIDTDGGSLLLLNGGDTLSYLKYTQQYPHLSYGVDENGKVGYMEPSPMADNTISYESIKSRCAKPQFSETPGLKSSSFKLELATSTEDAVIYYTTNGDIPSVDKGKVYTSPIQVRGTTVVRAIAVKDGLLKSEMSTGSYIYSDANHNRCNGLTANIVSIVTDTKFYYDSMEGMYTDGKNGTTMACITKPKNYAQDWTRAANMEYVVDSAVVVNQEVETNIKGGCSRANSTKSLGIKTNKKSGKKGFDYVFFPEQRPGLEYSALHLRNGGNAYSSTVFRDGYMASLANATGLDCQAYEPVAAYINGKYMGMMGLRTPSNKSYVETQYGLDESEIDFIEFAQQINVMAGDSIVYNQLITSLREDDPSSPDYYNNASKLMDVDNYIDYQIFEQFIANTDWPGNNQKLWRERVGGKFRWIAYDLDFGLGLYDNNLSKKETNMLKYVLGNLAGTWNVEPWMISPFAELIKNDEFKYRFLIKFMHHMKYSFSESVLDSVWMSISDKIADEYCASKSRDSEKDYLTMRSFALGRPANIYKHLKDYYKAGKQVVLQVTVMDESGDVIPHAMIHINNVPLGESDYTVDYYAGIPLKVEVKAPAGYKFKEWYFSSDIDYEGEYPLWKRIFEGKLTDNMNMIAVFEKVVNPQPLTLQINEVCASNSSSAGNPDECGHYSDWIEIYNFGKEDVDLAGMYISDDSTQMMKYQFPYGYNDTKVAPGEYVIVWADDESWRGPLHTNFKISASGSFIGLANNVQDYISYLDSVTCPSMRMDESYGRYENGDEWGSFSTVDGENQVTFGKLNRPKHSDPNSVIQPVSIDESVVVYPNPTSNQITVQAVGQNSKILSLSVYNAQGVMLQTFADVNKSKITVPVESLASGIYIIKAETNYAVTHKRVVKD